MPRYFFFNVHDGRSALDREGTEFPDAITARQEAIRFAGQLLADDARHVEISDHWLMEVTDEAGLALFRVDFHVTASPSVVGMQRPKIGR